jgi:hypothetical protein
MQWKSFRKEKVEILEYLKINMSIYIYIMKPNGDSNKQYQEVH